MKWKMKMVLLKMLSLICVKTDGPLYVRVPLILKNVLRKLSAGRKTFDVVAAAGVSVADAKHVAVVNANVAIDVAVVD